MSLSMRFPYFSWVLLSALCAFAIGGCWISIDDETPSTGPTHFNEQVPREELSSSNQVARTSESAPVGKTGSTNSTVHGDYVTSPRRHVPAPLRLKIFESTAIVRATLVSSAAATERYSAADGVGVDRDKESIEDWWPQDGEYRASHRFGFRVAEYLKGSGALEITVAARTLGTYGTEAQALQAATDSLGERDTSRDTHEAILFLWEPTSSAEFRFLRSGPYPSLHYTIDTMNRVWLPAKDTPAAGDESSSSDDSSLLYLTEEPLGTAMSTMSLSDLRSEITAVDALIAAGDGTEEYKECIAEGWRYEQTYPEPRVPPETEYQLASGTSERTALKLSGHYGPGYNRTLIQGRDKDLFRAVLIDDDDLSNNGYRIGEATGRPLPAGTYQYNRLTQRYQFIPCNFIPYYSNRIRNVVVTAPAGVLHELFFDPVAVGSTVVAGGTNGVLEPTTFTDANGASATIGSIEWESGTVKLEVRPHTGLTGHTVDIIELDGTVSLSLDVNDSTVDATNNTLSWSVSSQPWEDGDLLMVRIHSLLRACSDERVAPNAGGNPGLVSDCIALLAAKDALRGTASLNWGADTAITDWTGIKVTGTPSRVTSLDLSMRGLDGSIPPGLGSLTGLDILSLDNNRLSGAIPPQLGSLTNLRFLYLYKNRLTGGIPAELGSLASLNTMWLFNNHLTGSIPAELEDLANLERLGLDNNQLTGCIPPELRDVPENDLGRLGLSDCAVPGSVSTPTVSVGDESLDVSWTAPSEDGGSTITRYKVRYKRSADSSWTAGGTATTTDATVSGLVNGTPYEVQVRACTVGGCGPWSDSATGTPRAPLVLPTVEDQSAKEGQAFSKALSEAAGGVAPYTYTVTGLRAGLTFEASTRTISGTPTAAGDQSVTYTVTDSASGSAEQTFTIAVAAPSCSDTGLSSDCAVLLAAKDALRGTATLNWSKKGTAVTSWDGVTLGGAPRRVTGLDLHGRNLTGSIPSGLSGLTHLQILRLYDNQLTGSIPWQLGSLTNLRILSVSNNRLTGSIPTQLGSLTNLQILLISNNRLTGSIPTQLGSLTNLRSLWLSGNRLTGRIPTQLGSLTNLHTLLLDFNRLSGSIPSELTNLTRLITLWISENNLTGCIPPALRNVRFHDLDQLGLSDCAGGTSGQPPSDSGGQPDSLSPPVFGQEVYSFTVSEDAATGAVVGSVAAEGPDGAPVAYRIAGGNEAGRLSVGASGEIAVVASLDYETASSYRLTVAATEAYGGATATVTVEVIVTDVTEPSS